ncbi:type II secretion system protein J [uncultured Roseobacter sp.]|uniref:PulJ/GspJ family protein n=1 Tax=uncultured Roseobacter sp. TaxID=114847 RepID=UPI00262DE007|nr:prepilin-type N-terminal cleavage/methylation domain-containing protein [uncultured Roseobacter sp.]
MTHRCGRSGVTLIEMLVALSVFSLIGLASFAVLDTILRTDRQTSGRLAALARIEIALQIFETDVLRAQTRPTISAEQLSLATGDGSVSYAQTPGGMMRRIDRTGLDRLEQQLLPPPASAAWRFVTPATSGGPDQRAAIELVIRPEGNSTIAVRKLVPVPPALTEQP